MSVYSLVLIIFLLYLVYTYTLAQWSLCKGCKGVSCPKTNYSGGTVKTEVIKVVSRLFVCLKRTWGSLQGLLEPLWGKRELLGQEGVIF